MSKSGSMEYVPPEKARNEMYWMTRYLTLWSIIRNHDEVDRMTQDGSYRRVELAMARAREEVLRSV